MSKRKYCLTRNGDKLTIVESLQSLVWHIHSNAIDCVDGEYVLGSIVGNLLAYDMQGNRYSGCIVDDTTAIEVEQARAARLENAFQQFLAAQ